MLKSVRYKIASQTRSFALCLLHFALIKGSSRTLTPTQIVEIRRFNKIASQTRNFALCLLHFAPIKGSSRTLSPTQVVEIRRFHIIASQTRNFALCLLHFALKKPRLSVSVEAVDLKFCYFFEKYFIAFCVRISFIILLTESDISALAKYSSLLPS